MANSITGNPLIIDTEGIISTMPLTIQSILLIPNAAGDSATFTYWIESETRYNLRTRDAKTVTLRLDGDVLKHGEL